MEGVGRFASEPDVFARQRQMGMIGGEVDESRFDALPLFGDPDDAGLVGPPSSVPFKIEAADDHRQETGLDMLDDENRDADVQRNGRDEVEQRLGAAGRYADGDDPDGLGGGRRASPRAGQLLHEERVAGRKAGVEPNRSRRGVI